MSLVMNNSVYIVTLVSNNVKTSVCKRLINGTLQKYMQIKHHNVTKLKDRVAVYINLKTVSL